MFKTVTERFRKIKRNILDKASYGSACFNIYILESLDFECWIKKQCHPKKKKKKEWWRRSQNLFLSSGLLSCDSVTIIQQMLPNIHLPLINLFLCCDVSPETYYLELSLIFSYKASPQRGGRLANSDLHLLKSRQVKQCKRNEYFCPLSLSSQSLAFLEAAFLSLWGFFFSF